jgi:hypothetical protein
MLTFSRSLVASLPSRKPPPVEQRDAIYKKSLEEQQAGLISSFMDKKDVDALFGINGWAAVMRFAVCQHGKWRNIDNGKHGANWTFEANETIHTASAPAVAALVRRMRARVGQKLRGKWKLTAGSRDMKSAYKQIAMHSSQAPFVVITIWDIATNRWRFVITRALLFGLSGAVLLFNRIPNLLVAIARRWLAIPCHAFFDDFRIVDFADEAGSAETFFDKLMKILGIRFDNDKVQSRMDRLPMLGNIECFDNLEANEAFTVAAKEERLKDISKTVSLMLQQQSVQSGAASSLRGKLLHIAATRPGRNGRLPTPSLNLIADGKAAGWSPGLELDLRFVLNELEKVHERRYPLMANVALGPRIWSDASFSQCEGVMKMRICTIVATESHAEGIVTDAPNDLFEALVERSTQITVGELLGILFAFVFFERQLNGTSTVAFCDNMAALQGAINGSSSALDLCCLSHMLSLRLADIDVTLWIEYVQTLSNIADGGSREGSLCKVSAANNIVLRDVVCPVLPSGFPRANSNFSSFWK